MKQYSFLQESKSNDNLSVHFYDSFKNFTSDQQNSICWLLQELDKHDYKLQKKISNYGSNNAQKCLNENEWKDSLNKSDYLYCTCESNDKVVAVCLIEKPHPKSVNCYSVRMLIVDHQYRGHGIGIKMLNSIKKKFNKLFIKVVANNEPAYNLYTKVGFKPWLISMIWD